MNFSDVIAPLFFAVSVLLCSSGGAPVYDLFVKGASEGVKAAVRLAPLLITMCICVSVLQCSGLLDSLSQLFSVPAKALFLPVETLPLMILRPLSGSGALSMLQDLLVRYGPDSAIGRVASMSMAAGDTVFYILTLYFGHIGIKKTRYALPFALIAALSGSLVCGLIAHFFWG